MAYRNYIFIDENLKDKPIYRVFPIERCLQMLTTKKLTLVKPWKWEDPFENALLKSNFQIAGESASFGAKDSVYGQCWTTHQETDAMWRIYSHHKDGICLSTTPRKLLEALENGCLELAKLSCFIGKVQYQSQNKMMKSFKEINLLDSNGSGIAESLLYKRQAFSHEDEIRLIYIYNGKDEKDEKYIFQFDIDPDTLFDKGLFDPRMGEELIEAYAREIERLGYKIKVQRSKLYDAPKNWSFKLSDVDNKTN